MLKHPQTLEATAASPPATSDFGWLTVPHALSDLKVLTAVPRCALTGTLAGTGGGIDPGWRTSTDTPFVASLLPHHCAETQTRASLERAFLKTAPFAFGAPKRSPCASQGPTPDPTPNTKPTLTTLQQNIESLLESPVGPNSRPEAGLPHGGCPEETKSARIAATIVAKFLMSFQDQRCSAGYIGTRSLVANFSLFEATFILYGNFSSQACFP